MREQAASFTKGVVALLVFAAMGAATDVYGGNRLQTVSPQNLAAISFSLTAIVFICLELAQHGVSNLRLLATRGHDVTAINVTTAVTWLTMLYALKFLEPTVVSMVGLALGPVLIVLAGPVLRRGSSVMRTEIAVSIGICVLLCVLVWGSYAGKTAVGHIDTSHVTLGVFFAVICAIGSSGNIIYMKRLGETGCDPKSVLAIRFFLTIAVSWVLTILSGSSGIATAFIPGVIMAIIGIGSPIYILQIGIKYTEPITTSLLVSVSPIFAYLMEFLDRRLQPSTLTAVGVLGIVGLALIGTIARGTPEFKRAATSSRGRHRDSENVDSHKELLS